MRIVLYRGLQKRKWPVFRGLIAGMKEKIAIVKKARSS